MWYKKPKPLNNRQQFSYLRIVEHSTSSIINFAKSVLNTPLPNDRKSPVTICKKAWISASSQTQPKLMITISISRFIFCSMIFLWYWGCLFVGSELLLPLTTDSGGIGVTQVLSL
jgi:hypothetical protein